MLTQRLQIAMQRRVIAPTLAAEPGPPPPFPPIMRFLTRYRWLRNLPARAFGYGFRRERVQFGRSDQPPR